MDIELAQTLAENKLLKSLLYCTKRSCNNCGKVTCENFQRQRVDCCGNWVSYKDYIKELEAQIEKMKCCSNCKFDSLEPPEVISNGVCENCINHSKWEIED
ncbi:MAG: hypothetical protein K6G09_06705 [Treponema sp.]|nr:hypothetical protein [Treponema sp.]